MNACFRRTFGFERVAFGFLRDVFLAHAFASVFAMVRLLPYGLVTPLFDSESWSPDPVTLRLGAPML